MNDLVVDNMTCENLLLAAGFNALEVSEDNETRAFLHQELDHIAQASHESRFLTALSIILSNNLPSLGETSVDEIVSSIDNIISDQVLQIVQNSEFKHLEEKWRSIYELSKVIDNNKTKLALLDVSKEELAEDFEATSANIMSGDFFQKVYVQEYDQFGGEPYSAIIGLYEFENTHEDIEWLSTMGRVSEAAHAPFIAAVSPKFFGGDHYANLSDIKNIDGLVAHPRYGNWNAFRKTRAAGYIGLTLPNFMIRPPYDPDTYPARKGVLRSFKETVDLAHPDANCLWGNAAVLFAKNLYRSFAITGWCQSITGPTSGGLVEGLSIFNYNTRDANAYVLPVNFLIPDHKEFGLAKAGFIPLVYEKKSANACFFSAQSLKIPEEFEDVNDSENSQLITKLPYTFSISRIALYVKCMTRDAIGSEADEAVLESKLSTWINQYVTTSPNPSTLTTSYYPFKMAEVKAEKNKGMAGWYKCTITVLPHIKFEGMDVTLRVDTRLNAG